MPAPGSTPISSKEDGWVQENLLPELASKVAILTLGKPTFHLNCCEDTLQTVDNRTLGNQLPQVA